MSWSFHPPAKAIARQAWQTRRLAHLTPNCANRLVRDRASKELLARHTNEFSGKEQKSMHLLLKFKITHAREHLSFACELHSIGTRLSYAW
jgi:exopolyphosphatase/pppGpp-phosphohydrolase